MRLLTLAILALAALACGPAEKDGIALVGGTVISGAGDAALPDAVVIIRAGEIVAVAARADIEIPKNAEIIDVSGRWIVPGFIDGHAHVARWALDRYVAAGVTTVRDMHGIKDSILGLKEEAGLGGIVSPRIFTASAMIDGPGTELGATEVERERGAPRGGRPRRRGVTSSRRPLVHSGPAQRSAGRGGHVLISHGRSPRSGGCHYRGHCGGGEHRASDRGSGSGQSLARRSVCLAPERQAARMDGVRAGVGGTRQRLTPPGGDGACRVPRGPGPDPGHA
jgi:hypothetical protein